MARILIIDDEADNREVIGALLRRDGHDVQAVWSAENALAALTGVTFDVILLDVQLPGMSGLRAIQEIRGLSKAKILVMTGHDDANLRADAKALGADGFLGKPLDFPALRALLAEKPAP